MAIILNIGLMTSSKITGKPSEAIPVEIARATVKHFTNIFDAVICNSDTEPTLVLTVSNNAPISHANAISDILCQDCVALYDTTINKGYLLGRYAKSWGEFNPKYFILPDGSRLA